MQYAPTQQNTNKFGTNKINIKEKFAMNKRKDKGITLVALVITIIVLLILAGVSLSMVFNQNGLIAKAQQAVNETEKAKNNETSDIDKLTGQIDSYQVPVPEGFYHVEGSTIENGFVISSEKDDDLANTKQGNQFVWIPVTRDRKSVV